MYKKAVGARFLAYIIDMLVMFFGLGSLLHYVFGLGTAQVEAGYYGLNFNLFEYFLMGIIYFTFFGLISKGASLGSLIVGTRAREMDLKELTYQKALLRSIIKGVLNPISIISFIVVLFNQDKKSLHDMAMNTIVVRKVSENEYMNLMVEKPNVEGEVK